MKRLPIHSLQWTLLWALVQGALAVGCNTALLRLEGVTGEVPSEAGQARVKRVAPGVAQLDVRIGHVAPLREIDARATHYVVWAQAPGPGEGPQNLGSLEVNPRGLAKFRGYVKDTALRFFVTAEPTTLAQQPTGDELLWTSVVPGSYSIFHRKVAAQGGGSRVR